MRKSKLDAIDVRFALVDSKGVERYPYRMTKRDGRSGFVLGTDRHGMGEVVQTLEEVVHGVVFDGKRVRTTCYPPTASKGGNGLSLANAREVKGYRIAPELQSWVHGAALQPMGFVEGPNRTGEPMDAFAALTAKDYQRALDTIEPTMTPAQRQMLRGHANAPEAEQAMRDIAYLGGYGDVEAANVQYGRLGQMFAQALSIDHSRLENKVQAICVDTGKVDATGHFVWRLRPQLVQALQDAGWVESPLPPEEALSAAAVTEELGKDAKWDDTPETIRQALINARIGQGGYRKRMMRVWGERCAVTGVGVQKVLIASHAKSWQESDNHERLDEYNGLLLTANLDRLFDSGLIAFSDSGEMLVHSSLSPSDRAALGLATVARLRFVPSRCIPYLKAHRQRFGYE